jgi:endopeptidase Clp ATP-binding regulatory subunit ClpX
MERSAMDPREIERELREFLGKRFGGAVQLAGATPIGVPQQQPDGEDEDEPAPSAAAPLPAFDLKPEQLEAYLEQYVVRQDAAKEVLATKVCTHYNRIKLFREHPGESRFAGVGNIKSNILMLGPTGVGKTYLVKLIARKIGIPFVKGDATKFSETGYVGADVEDLVRDLVREAGGDIRLAEHGIVYIDEIDKIASAGSSHGPDVSRTGVQRALLKPMEETDVELRVAHDMVSQMEALQDWQRTGKREKKTVNTRNILFILSGAFTGLDEIVKRRLSRSEIGFRSVETVPPDATASWYLHRAAAEDLIAYGFESEFVGRLPVTVVLDPLSEEDLFAILRNPNCPVIQGKKADFKAYGIDLHFEDEALRKLAALAYRQRTGARGLASVVEATLLKFEKKLPSTDIRRLVVTPEIVDDPARELALLLANPAEPGLAARFERLAAAERADFGRAIEAQAPPLRARCRLPLGPELTDLAVRRMAARGTDAEEACRAIEEAAAALDRFLGAFSEKNGITRDLAPAAREHLIVLAGAAPADVEALCAKVFANYALGLNLLRERTGRDVFPVPVDAVADPDGHLNRLIKESYAQ